MTKNKLPEAASRYQARGVSASKTEVHQAIDSSKKKKLYAYAFCELTEDILGGDADYVNVTHSDGSGTKSILAYLSYKETGDPTVFRGIAQDSIVMNIDDLLCVGVTDRILLSSTINRNSHRCPGEVLRELIGGTEEFLQNLRDHGIGIVSGGGETADVGDLTGTITVDSCATARLKKSQVHANPIGPGLCIVGFSSSGQASYEQLENSGIGSNGLTSARHELLCNHYAIKYPETYSSLTQSDLVYCGPFRMEDSLPGSSMRVGDALLSPTRTYAPLVKSLYDQFDQEKLKALIHCTGGAQSKCLRFAENTLIIKNNMFEPPAIFKEIQRCSQTPYQEMFQVFNMGHRLEAYCDESIAEEVIALAQSFGIQAKTIGYTEANPGISEVRIDWQGNSFHYRP